MAGAGLRQAFDLFIFFSLSASLVLLTDFSINHNLGITNYNPIDNKNNDVHEGAIGPLMEALKSNTTLTTLYLHGACRSLALGVGALAHARARGRRGRRAPGAVARGPGAAALAALAVLMKVLITGAGGRPGRSEHSTGWISRKNKGLGISSFAKGTDMLLTPLLSEKVTSLPHNGGWPQAKKTYVKECTES